MLGAIKSVARTSFPRGYRWLARAKDRIAAPGWNYYFDAADPSLLKPERCTIALAPTLPKHIDTVLIIGCAPGRDFIPFQDKYKLRGFDLAPFERIKWVCDTSRLDYRQMTAQEFTRTLNEDLSRTLVYTCGTLMQLSANEQRELYDALKKNGCKNFIFLEPPPDHFEFGEAQANRCFALPLADFEAHPEFRDDGFMAYVRLSDHTAY